MSQVPGGPPAGGYPPAGGVPPQQGGYPPQQGGYPAQQPPAQYPPAGGAPPPQNWQPAPAGGPPPGGSKGSKNKIIAIVAGSVVGLALIGIGVKAFLGKDKADLTATSSDISGDGNLQPVPISSGSAVPPPTQPPTAPPSSPPPPTGGVQVDLEGVVTFNAPPPWEVQFDEDNAAALADGRDNFAYVAVGTTDPSTDAGSYLAQSMETLLPPDLYSQVQVGDVTPLQPSGAVVSAAVVEYEATWTDSQNSFPLHGAAFAAIRQDGSLLVGTIESVPPEEFANRKDQWGPMLSAILDAFAGTA